MLYVYKEIKNMNLYEKIKNKEGKLSVISLNYVEWSLIISFSKKSGSYMI